MTDETCVNCGWLSKGLKMVRCRMRDRDLASQNREITAHYTGPQLERLIYTGQRVYAEVTRPLCVRCAEANEYTCWICELEKLEEEARK